MPLAARRETGQTSRLRGRLARLGRSVGKEQGSLLEMLRHNWYLGFTAFGGPAVHVQIFRRLFVESLHWLDMQTYQEIFALTQSLPGPGSTKMLYGINVLRSGHAIGLLAFFIWSLPGAFGAYGLGVGISRIQDTLPPPVYALLSGLNSATVGLIALSAVQLSQKAITDPLTRILVFFGGAAGMLYNALWYFPVLMVAGCLSTIVWDSQALQRLTPLLRRKGAERRQPESPNHQDSRAIGALPTHAREPERELQEITIAAPAVQVPETALIASIVRETVDRDGVTAPGCADIPTDGEAVKEDHANSAAKNRQTTESIDEDAATPVTTTRKGHRIHWKTGTAVVAAFIASFIVIVTLRGTLHKSPLGFQLFANLYLAGTIIFGGGPVVIPLLRSYVVGPGWVSPRDFLLGLAIIQAFPGPNFNFAVYLGTLASRYPGSGINTATGAVIGFLAIFSPGITLHTGFMGIWQAVRTRKWVVSGLRGINATAVGLIYAAVYRLWEIGFLSESARNGSSLGQDPWWLVTAATSYVGGMWFRLEPPVAILLGGVMGMVWYGVQQA